MLRTRILFFSVVFFEILLCGEIFAKEDNWMHMPAGGRPTYMGIHGGTMPVSLLVSDDGASLLTFVGRTGNDFLELLHRTEFQLPSLLKKTIQNSTRSPLTNTVLHAGDTNVSMPVLVLTDIGYMQKTVETADLIPFGLSQKPVAIEGQVRLPRATKPKRKQYRLFFQPHYLTPR